MKNSLTADLFDKLTGTRTAPRQKIIWGALAIGQRIGCSADFVRETLIREEGSPVKKIGNRYCAHEDDLFAFFRAKPQQT